MFVSNLSGVLILFVCLFLSDCSEIVVCFVARHSRSTRFRQATAKRSVGFKPQQSGQWALSHSGHRSAAHCPACIDKENSEHYSRSNKITGSLLFFFEKLSIPLVLLAKKRAKKKKKKSHVADNVVPCCNLKPASTNSYMIEFVTLT